ncbi:diphosphomevalonate decarboxylase-like isoform X2 [Actinia tenebrosa]|uniref:Diphosphomevalonate decarboxylase n=1 Tax=Actinia tenebrosa TaxID=6105 RepID=A0A6P8HTE3_ACTTE|nr:diphosphomevalonate decarboxylase-like isoform X2 [Actinia tenebrosa]
MQSAARGLYEPYHCFHCYALIETTVATWKSGNSQLQMHQEFKTVFSEVGIEMYTMLYVYKVAVANRVRDKCQLESPQRWQELKDCHLHIASKNNFPTAAGLASSASGHACLVFLLSKLFHLKCELSGLARQGSGSACRSIYGGFVVWSKGEHEDGTDSIAKQIMPSEHWPSLRILILVVNDQKKSTSSTEGMKRSVQTSELLQLRATYCVPQRMKNMEEAIIHKDFETFAELTMKESNQFHAVCQDTYPPIEPPYLSTTSHSIIQLVTAYNQYHKNTKVAYTFDAGPNAVLFLQEKDVSEMAALIQHFFPPLDTKGFIKGIPIQEIPKLSKDLLESMAMYPVPSSIKYIISTKVGNGPSMIAMDSDEHLLNEDGLPH